MPVKTRITIEDAELVTSYRYDVDEEYEEATQDELVKHVFMAEVDPNELRRIFPPPPPHRIEGMSVLNVSGHPHPHRAVEGLVSLDIDPRGAELVALGTESYLLVCEAFDNEAGVIQARLRAGDKEFLANLPRELGSLGWELLSEIRSTYLGELHLNEKVRRYVESPDQWFTIKPQLQKKNFALTVRGRPTSFLGMEGAEFTATTYSDEKSVVVNSTDPAGPSAIVMKPDGGSSSRFVLSGIEQMPTAMRILQWASKNRK